jgi:hypothetical protein
MTNRKLPILKKTSSRPIEHRIYLIRGQKVMISADLADLYQVQPKALMQAVKRNLSRFPEDFMFQLNKEEFEHLKSQIVTSSWGGLRRALPYAFTQEGIAMLSSVLRSNQAIEVNIQIMRAFIQLRRMMVSNKSLNKKISRLENKYNENFKIIFVALQKLFSGSAKPPKRIGFETDDQ